MKAITSIIGKDINSTNPQDISYTSENKTWKILAKGRRTFNVLAISGLQTFTISGLPSGGIGICYINVPEHPAIYRLPKSEGGINEILMGYPDIETYSGTNNINVIFKNRLLTAMSIEIIFIWLERE